MKKKSKWIKYLKSLKYENLVIEDKVPRSEADITEEYDFIKKLRTFAEIFAYRAHLKELSSEMYAFKYVKNNSIPWHRDRNRHKLTLIAYFGDFTGGEYVYFNSKNEEISIKPKSGDVIVSINETICGREINPLHKVNPIVHGVRYCSVVSLTSTDYSAIPFGN